MFYIFLKEAKEFLLAGSVKDKDLVHQNLYPIEFLNTLTKESYNTKLIVKKFQQHIIDAEIEPDI
uniref:Uncharacterized protein n=1 Tax=Rhizophagus irregularis (strain DAOM 181602 / DAOM 197198 / MUCL 43194) TaxID=747089 RepID=U9U7H6_RHIID